VLRAGLAAAALCVLAVDTAAFDAREYDRAARTILCDCGCHPQSVHDCACARAAEMRDEIRGEIEQGRTGDEVIAAYVARHGEAIRIAPVASGFNLLAWLGPFAALVVAAFGLVLVARRWVRPAGGTTAPPVASATPDVDAYRERLRREVEELR
jgi:cytochrome c-type biogenesis protein CcmH